MKKFIQLFGGTVVCLLLGFAGASPAFAQNNENQCSVEGTGPNSTNECEVISQETCDVENGNFISVDNDNYQFVITGNGEQSGEGNNENATTITVTIGNGAESVDGVCLFAAPTTPVTPVTPVTPETPSTPQVLPAQTVAPVGGVAAGSGSSNAILIVSLSILALTLGLAGLSRVAIQKF